MTTRGGGVEFIEVYGSLVNMIWWCIMMTCGQFPTSLGDISLFSNCMPNNTGCDRDTPQTNLNA